MKALHWLEKLRRQCERRLDMPVEARAWGPCPWSEGEVFGVIRVPCPTGGWWVVGIATEDQSAREVVAAIREQIAACAGPA